MITIYTSSNLELLPEHLLFVEIENGKPLHPKYLIPKVKDWILNNKDFNTISEIALLVPGYMIRNHKIKKPIRIHYIFPDKTFLIIHHDIKGDFIEPWPEIPMCESIMEADFHLRFHQ